MTQNRPQSTISTLRLLLPTALSLSLAAPALAARTETLTCIYGTAAGGKATVSVVLDKASGSAVAVTVADLRLRKAGQSGKGLKVTRWDVTRTSTEIDFTSAQGMATVPGHVSFEAQDDVFRFEVKGAPPVLRQALKLRGGWFVLVIAPGAAECRMATVGVATMKPDGAVHMQLRSYDHGLLAEALQIVKRGDPQYKTLLEHLGGLKPGESKPIPEFPPDGEIR